MTDRFCFDASALTKLVVDEEGSDLAVAIFGSADEIYASELGYVEVVSALTRRVRNREIQVTDLNTLLSTFESRWQQLQTLPIEASLIREGAALILQFPLSGADAVHLATAMDMRGYGDVTFVTWDRQQAAAARALGLDVQPSASA